MSQDISGKVNGVKYIVDSKLVESFKERYNIDAVLEIETAIKKHQEIIEANNLQEHK